MRKPSGHMGPVGAAVADLHTLLDRQSARQDADNLCLPRTQHQVVTPLQFPVRAALQGAQPPHTGRDVTRLRRCDHRARVERGPVQCQQEIRQGRSVRVPDKHNCVVL